MFNEIHEKNRRPSHDTTISGEKEEVEEGGLRCQGGAGMGMSLNPLCLRAKADIVGVC
jgi:hypothetical protein